MDEQITKPGERNQALLQRTRPGLESIGDGGPLGR